MPITYPHPHFSLETRNALYPDIIFPKVYHCRDLNLWYAERDFKHGSAKSGGNFYKLINTTNPETEIDRNDPDFYIMNSKVSTLDFKHDKIPIPIVRVNNFHLKSIDMNNNTAVVQEPPSYPKGSIKEWLQQLDNGTAKLPEFTLDYDDVDSSPFEEQSTADEVGLR